LKTSVVVAARGITSIIFLYGNVSSPAAGSDEPWEPPEGGP